MKRIIITNARSRANRRDPKAAGRLNARLGAVLHAPDTLGALQALAPDLADADELWVHGGDGTLHRVLTALHREGRPPPPVTVLRAGTMNIVADSVGQRASPDAVVEAVVSGRAARETCRAPLVVDVGNAPPCVGFLAGAGIISRFLELYYGTPDPTPADAAWLLARGAASALVGGRLARRLTQPFEGALVVDGVAWPRRPWMAVAMGTVEQLGLGFRPFPDIHEHLDVMHVIGIGSGIGALARELPSVYRGRGVHRPGNREVRAGRVELRDVDGVSCMVDGEFYAAPEAISMRVGAPVRFRVW